MTGEVIALGVSYVIKNQTLPLCENCTPEAVLQKLLDGNLKSNGTGLWLTGLIARFPLVEVFGAVV